MDSRNFNLNRFVEAQERMYPVALKELRDGWKRSHWMWYIFPQLKDLGSSHYAKFYGISGIEEAKAYIADPILGQRIREVSETILNLPGNDARAVFGGIDSIKLRSSMTLFDHVAPNAVFAHVLEKYFNGRRDPLTLGILEGGAQKKEA